MSDSAPLAGRHRLPHPVQPSVAPAHPVRGGGPDAGRLGGHGAATAAQRLGRRTLRPAAFAGTDNGTSYEGQRKGMGPAAQVRDRSPAADTQHVGRRVARLVGSGRWRTWEGSCPDRAESAHAVRVAPALPPAPGGPPPEYGNTGRAAQQGYRYRLWPAKMVGVHRRPGRRRSAVDRYGGRQHRQDVRRHAAGRGRRRRSDGRRRRRPGTRMP